MDEKTTVIGARYELSVSGTKNQINNLEITTKRVLEVTLL